MEQWVFSASDSWFFKEARPMEAVGASRLDSLFPPPAKTVIGAIRTSIGDALGVDWREYAAGAHPLRQIMGTPDDLAPLSFDGPYLMQDGKRLYPMPQSLLWTAGGEQTSLLPGHEAVECDLGRVRLPQKARPLAGANPAQDAWLTEQGLVAFLSGQPVPASAVVRRDQLFATEDRLGIARDNARRVTGDGLLYQTRHVRPQPGCAMGIQVHGLSEERLPKQGVCRLGAEGRLAGWERLPAKGQPTVAPPAKIKGIQLMLLTPALFAQGWIPDGLVETEQDGCKVWEGDLCGVTLTMVCAAVGKPRREGGWDLVNKKPRDLNGLIPAGSVYFCQVKGDPRLAQQALHGQLIGQEQAWGRGKLVAGFY